METLQESGTEGSNFMMEIMLETRTDGIVGLITDIMLVADTEGRE